MSDSHDHLENIRKAVKVFLERRIEVLLHAGDFCSPFVFRELEPLKGRISAMYGVFGNNDGDRVLLVEKSAGLCTLRDAVSKLEIGGRRIVIMHYPDVAENLYNSGDFDLVIFGHTHQLVEKRNERATLINPGTVAGYLADRATVAIYESETGSHEIVTLAS